MSLVRVITGYGPEPEETIEVEVAYFAEFLRGADHLCALCHGDPVNWHPQWETCPVCDGRPS